MQKGTYLEQQMNYQAAQHVAIMTCTQMKQVEQKCMTVVLCLRKNPRALWMLFKTYDIMLDNKFLQLFNNRWLSPTSLKTGTNNNLYHCTLYTTEINNNYRWSSLPLALKTLNARAYSKANRSNYFFCLGGSKCQSVLAIHRILSLGIIFLLRDVHFLLCAI